MADKYLAVIGTQFGNEGKGKVVHTLASSFPGKFINVVRYNGGVFSGHTVQLENGVKHVFSHFGSGTLAGANTILSRQFVCNPLVFRKEREELLAKKIAVPHPRVDQNCLLTTVYDMIFKSEIGKSPSGYQNTKYRTIYYTLRVGNTAKKGLLHTKRWYEERFPHEISQFSELNKELWHSEKTVNKQVEDIDYFNTFTIQIPDDNHIDCDVVIYEGSQGLYFDDDYGSRDESIEGVGHKGIYNLLNRSTTSRISMKTYYVSRPYLYRLDTDPVEKLIRSKLPYAKFKDDTNFSPTQKFAAFNLDTFSRHVTRDKMYRGEDTYIFNCMDHVDDNIHVQLDNRRQVISTERFRNTIRNTLTPNIRLSYTPTGSDLVL